MVVPSLDDIQHALNKATHYVLEVSRGVAQWGQDRTQQPVDSAHAVHIPASQLHNAKKPGTEEKSKHFCMILCIYKEDMNS